LVSSASAVGSGRKERDSTSEREAVVFGLVCFA